jgi:hypothetical protein
MYYKNDIDEYIIENTKKNKLIGNIILKELTEKVFHPKRLLKLCDIYGITFDELLESY